MIRVLIADDHEVIRAGVRTILASRGDIELFEASDGKEVVRKTRELRPDLVILDMTMPVMGGYATALELRRLAPDVPVLFFSIYEGPQIVNDARHVGARGFLNKNNAGRALLNAVDELVTRKGTFFPPTELQAANAS